MQDVMIDAFPQAVNHLSIRVVEAVAVALGKLSRSHEDFENFSRQDSILNFNFLFLIIVNELKNHIDQIKHL